MKNIKKFESFNQKINEHGETKNYMFFGNLQTIKRLVDEMLEMNETELDSILTEHDWASDHISVATENLEHVFNFLAGNNSQEETEKPLLGGPESSHTVQDNHMRNMVKPEDDENIKGFEDFQ
jgi:hypothetical protein